MVRFFSFLPILVWKITIIYIHIGHPDDKYKRDAELGAGAGGTVYLYFHKKNMQKVAIKHIDMTKQPKKDLIVMEIKVMKELQHKNLVNFIEAYLIGTDLWVVMEYMAGKKIQINLDHKTIFNRSFTVIYGHLWSFMVIYGHLQLFALI